MDIKELIGELGGQAHFARRFEIPYRTVQNWYRGERTPPVYVLHMMCQLTQKTEEARVTQNQNTQAWREIEDLQQENDDLLQKLAETYAALRLVEFERDAYEAENKEMEKKIRRLEEILYKE